MHPLKDFMPFCLKRMSLWIFWSPFTKRGLWGGVDGRMFWSKCIWCHAQRKTFCCSLTICLSTEGWELWMSPLRLGLAPPFARYWWGAVGWKIDFLYACQCVARSLWPNLWTTLAPFFGLTVAAFCSNIKNNFFWNAIYGCLAMHFAYTVLWFTAELLCTQNCHLAHVFMVEIKKVYIPQVTGHLAPRRCAHMPACSPLPPGWALILVWVTCSTLPDLGQPPKASPPLGVACRH